MKAIRASTRRSGQVSLRAVLLLAGAATLVVTTWRWSSRPAPTPIESRAAAFPTRLAPEEISPAEALREATPSSGGYRREVERPKPVQDVADTSSREMPSPEQAPGGPSNRRRDEKKTLPEVFRMPADPLQQAPPAALPLSREPKAGAKAPATGRPFAPFGRLVKCQLVDTVDSITARSEPIVALVTQDLDWNGDVIIPAGTEAFSYAKPEPVLDASGIGRLVDEGEWTLVLPAAAEGENGRELVLRARALDRREVAPSVRGTPLSWEIGDGEDGLVGTTFSTQDDRELRLFAAAALSGMAQAATAVVERQQAAPGLSGVLGATQVAPTLGNAVVGSVGNGATELMNQVAGRIRDEISKRGVYVRVPAGKEFYLFVEQTIDPGTASVGLRLPPASRPKG
jgi:hypothetical protein